jgi:nucleoid-associated protein YgaU
MGLFSFLKEKGKQIFGKKEVEAAKEVKLSKVDQLKAEIDRLGIPVNDLRLEICEQVVVQGTTPTTETAEKLVLALGNVEGVGSVDDQLSVLNPEPQAVFYTVQSGDSLSKIARAQYGDAMAYNRIFEANQPLIKHPDEIYPGQVLRIPQ